MLYLILASTWRALPFITLLLLAAMQTVPHEIIESSRIDGARSWQVVRYILLPLMLPTLVVALFSLTLSGMNGVGMVFSLTSGGPGTSADPARAYDVVLEALEAYEQDWKTFYPYSSKYDAYLAGETQLSPAEARGLELFEAEDKGNCASCHFSQPGFDGTPPQLSDFGMIALGLPRNPAIPANADPDWHDLGLCGPLRTDFQGVAGYCGLFRTVSLRNVATRKAFFHNGVIHDLREAVAFYATRDTDPARWYPTLPDGSVDKFNDLPPRYVVNVNQDPPFGREPGGQPALTDAEIDDVVAFLGTLTDGWRALPEPSGPGG